MRRAQEVAKDLGHTGPTPVTVRVRQIKLGQVPRRLCGLQQSLGTLLQGHRAFEPDFRQRCHHRLGHHLWQHLRVSLCLRVTQPLQRSCAEFAGQHTAVCHPAGWHATLKHRHTLQTGHARLFRITGHPHRIGKGLWRELWHHTVNRKTHVGQGPECGFQPGPVTRSDPDQRLRCGLRLQRQVHLGRVVQQLVFQRTLKNGAQAAAGALA